MKFCFCGTFSHGYATSVASRIVSKRRPTDRPWDSRIRLSNIVITDTVPLKDQNYSTMPLITRSNSKESSDSGGGAIALSLLLRPRSPISAAAVLPGVSLDQRDVFTCTSDGDEMIESTMSATPRRSNKRSISAIRSPDEDVTEIMLASTKKRRTISDDTSSSCKSDPTFSTKITTSQPGPNDVMYGRGGETNAHIGNKKYRYIVESLKSKYSHAPRNEKPKIAMDVVSLWRKLDPPGRFLKENGKEQNSIEEAGADEGKWYDVGDDQAKKKTSQALREAANPDAQHYIKLFGRNEAELLHICEEYLQKKIPGNGDPSELLNQLKNRKKATERNPSSDECSLCSLQQSRLAPTVTATSPTPEPLHLHMPIPFPNRVSSDTHEQIRKTQRHHQHSLTPDVIGEIFESLDSNDGCKHDFNIMILPDEEKTISPPCLQYSEGTYLLLRPNVRIPLALSNRKLTEYDLSSMCECRWTMAGKNTGTEYTTRYMTPKTGRHDYNVDTRGVLLSRNKDGNDDNDVKILHIYCSKNANNPKKKTSERLPKQKNVKMLLPKGNFSLQAAPKSKKQSRQVWSEAEDIQLRQLVEEFTSSNRRIRWPDVSTNIPGRSGKQCRERWMYQIQPGLNREEFTPEEDALLDQLVETIGTKWSKIQKMMPGRSDMDLKNRWNSLERARKRKESKKQSIHKTVNGTGGQKTTAGTDALTSLCDVALAREQEECIERSMESGDTSTEGSTWSESPEVGMRVSVRFEDDNHNGGYTFYGGTIISSELQELQEMAAAMDIDGLANAVANAAHLSSSDQSHQMSVYSSGNMDASVAHQSKITIKYDDGSTEECHFPDPDIQLVAGNLSEEEMSLSNELLNLNVSLSLRDLYTKKEKRSDKKLFPVDSTLKHGPDYVPLETVRELLLGDLDPIELAQRLLPSEDIMLVRKKWRKSE